MKISVKLLFADHDDTAVMSTPRIHYPAHEEALRRLRPGRTPIGLEGWFARNYEPGIIEYLTGELGFDRRELEESTRIWREFTTAAIPDFFPGMAETLAEYRRRGGILVVVSHSEEALIARDYRAAAERLGLPELVPDFIEGWHDDPEERKPSPRPALRALERFRVAPEESLMLDDLAPGAAMAEAAGIPCAAAGWGHAVPGISAAMRARCARYFQEVAEFREFLLP
jgi:phosphoglycolate phosphatase/pyrophosphatase PpaX